MAYCVLASEILLFANLYRLDINPSPGDVFSVFNVSPMVLSYCFGTRNQIRPYTCTAQYVTANSWCRSAALFVYYSGSRPPFRIFWHKTTAAKLYGKVVQPRLEAHYLLSRSCKVIGYRMVWCRRHHIHRLEDCLGTPCHAIPWRWEGKPLCPDGHLTLCISL